MLTIIIPSPIAIYIILGVKLDLAFWFSVAKEVRCIILCFWSVILRKNSLFFYIFSPPFKFLKYEYTSLVLIWRQTVVEKSSQTTNTEYQLISKLLHKMQNFGAICCCKKLFYSIDELSKNGQFLVF